MKRRRKLSKQAVKLLQAFLAQRVEWRHGYDLAKEIGLQSGTLYPLLIRLTEGGLLESEWQPAAKQGLPARHAYRLTQKGLAVAHANNKNAPQQSGAQGLASI